MQIIPITPDHAHGPFPVTSVLRQVPSWNAPSWLGGHGCLLRSCGHPWWSCHHVPPHWQAISWRSWDLRSQPLSFQSISILLHAILFWLFCSAHMCTCLILTWRLIVCTLCPVHISVSFTHVDDTLLQMHPGPVLIAYLSVTLWFYLYK